MTLFGREGPFPLPLLSTLILISLFTLFQIWINGEVIPEDIRPVEEPLSDRPLDTFCGDLPYEEVAGLFASHIQGEQDAKKAPLLSLIGSEESRMSEGLFTRGNLHVLLIGDASKGKSQQLHAVLSMMKGLCPTLMVPGTGLTPAALTVSNETSKSASHIGRGHEQSERGCGRTSAMSSTLASPAATSDDDFTHYDDFMLCTDRLAFSTDNPLAGRRKRVREMASAEDRKNARYLLPTIPRPSGPSADLTEHIATVGAFLNEPPNLKISCLIMNKALVYLLGTDHVNPRCQYEVSRVIDLVKPDKVIVELCKLRACRCPAHMNSVFQNPAEFTFRYLRRVIAEIGFVPALIFMADVFSEMEVSGNVYLEFGGEMTGAIRHAKTVHRCQLLLGDRSIAVTIKRRASAMSWWTKVRLAAQVCLGLVCKFFRTTLLTNAHHIAQTDPMTPYIFIFERDLCLINAIQTATGDGHQHTKIVAVVGDGHTRGIHRYWGKMRPEIAKIIYEPRFDFRYQ